MVNDFGPGSAVRGIFFFECGQHIARNFQGNIYVSLLCQRRVLGARLVMLLPAGLLLLLRPRLLPARFLVMRLLRARLVAETGASLPRAKTGRVAARLLGEGVGHQVHAVIGRYGLRLSRAFPVSLRIWFVRGIPVILTRIIFAKHQIEKMLTDVRCFVKQYDLSNSAVDG